MDLVASILASFVVQGENDQHEEANDLGSLLAGLSAWNEICDGDAFYRPGTTQNEIVKICGEEILSQVCAEIKEAKYFSLLVGKAAEAIDASQMPLIARFVDSEMKVREEFIGLIVCEEGTPGRAISKKIRHYVQGLGLDMGLCRGQGSDKAGYMARRCFEAAARTHSKYPKAAHIHCASHALNLCIASACQNTKVLIMRIQVKRLFEFFSDNPECMKLLIEKIKLLLPSDRHSQLIDAVQTRWITNIDALGVFVEIYEAVITCLEIIDSNEGNTWTFNLVYAANVLLLTTDKFEFICCLVITARILEITRPLAKQFMSSQFDIVALSENINLLFDALKQLRLEIDEKHEIWYNEAVKLAESINACPSKPSRPRQQANCPQTTEETISQFYKISVTLPFIDHLTQQVESRFSDQNRTILNGFYGFPALVLSLPDWREKFLLFLNQYSGDLPKPCSLNTELDMWEEYWRLHADSPPCSLADLLPKIDRITFPNIHLTLRILATLPDTARICELSITRLGRLKAYLQNTKAEDRLNGLALINVHQEITIDTEAMVDRFAAKHPRRMELENILKPDPNDDNGSDNCSNCDVNDCAAVSDSSSSSDDDI